MTSDLDKTPSRGDRMKARAYYREFVPAMGAYLVILPLVITFGGLDGTAPSRVVWALLPLLPALAVVWSVWRHLQRQDEYQRLVLFQGFALGFGVMIVAAVTFGFLELAGLTLEGTPWYLFLIGMTGWGVSTGVLGARGGAR